MSGWHTSPLLPQRPTIAFTVLALGLVAVGSKVVATQQFESDDARAASTELVADSSAPTEPLEPAEPAHSSFAASYRRPRPITLSALEYAEPPLFELTARDGTTLARSVRGYALEASPFHLWLVHTPARIVGGLADVLGEHAPQDLGRALLGTDEFGWRSVDSLALTHDEARALRDWVAAGGPTAYPGIEPLPGLIVEPLVPTKAQPSRAGTGAQRFGLRWCPHLLLSESTRARIDRDLTDSDQVSAARWVRRLGSDLWDLLEGPRERNLAAWAAEHDEPPPGWQVAPPKTGLARLLDGIVEAPPSWRVSRAVPRWRLAASASEWVFDHLQDSRYVEVLERLPVELVPAVRAFLAEEHVGGFQMWLRPTSQRRYPASRLRVIGRVGWLADDVARRHGLIGLEHAAEVALTSRDLPVTGTHDRFERHALVRARADDQEYYRDHAEGAAPARVCTTLDPRVQAKLATALAEVEAQHDTSLTMGIVIDLDSRDVLAMDWRDPYEFGLFAPLQHSFTPGSTFKLVTMALALEHGYVEPGDEFDVGHGVFRVPGTTRVVHEAEGAATGRISAAMCLAKSSNAGMVQIGTSVPVPLWKSETSALGYGHAVPTELLREGWYSPAGIIGERTLPNDRNGWSLARSHTSVSFGDSMQTTLVQHVTALCALVHDGQLRPLRWLDALQVGPTVERLAPSGGPRVVSDRTVRELRAMMRLGAREGTGRRLARPDGLVIETKTGTYEKIEKGDVSYHAMGEDLARARALDADWDSNAAHRRLRGDWRGAKKGYTSSIVVVGQLAGEGRDARRVLVFLLAEDPRNESRFGSDVTGAAAVDVVAHALGIDERERSRRHTLADGRPRLEAFAVPAVEDLHERPWEEVTR